MDVLCSLLFQDTKGAEARRSAFYEHVDDRISGKSFILYADDIIEKIAILDFEDTVKNLGLITNGGKIVIFGKTRKAVDYIAQIVRRACPLTDIRTVTALELQRQTNVSQGTETEELDNLVKFARRNGIARDLAIIKSQSDMPGDSPELLVKWTDKAGMPVVVMGKRNEKEKAIYSFREAVTKALSAFKEHGENGWFISLDPVRAVTEELYREYQNYILTRIAA